MTYKEEVVTDAYPVPRYLRKVDGKIYTECFCHVFIFNLTLVSSTFAQNKSEGKGRIRSRSNQKEAT